MAVLRNLARMTTPTVGQGDLTLGAAVTGFLSLAQAGVVDGDSVSYGIFDYDGSGNHIASEVGRGTYNAGLGTLTRNVLDSTNGGAPIVLSGNAQVFVTVLSEDIPTDTSGLPDSVDKRYVTDAQLAVLANTSGVNTGDQDLSPYISGTGVVGQVAEFVTDTKTLQAAKLIAPTTHILTLTNAAAATLALNITAGKTLTLTAADNYTLTIPATGTAALLGTANVFTTQQMVDGTSDQIQLRVQAHSTQTANLLTFENSSGTILSRVVGNGSIYLSTDAIDTTLTPKLYITKTAVTAAFSAALMAVMDTAGVSSSGAYGLSFYGYARPGAGRTNNETHAILAQIALGAGTTTELIAYNARMTVATGASTNTSLFASDSYTMTSGTITNLYGLNIPALSKSGGTLTNHYGIFLGNVSSGATLNYAIYTNLGLVRFGDGLDIVGAVDRNQLKVTGFTTQTLPVGYLIDNTAATNTVRNVLQLETQSTGTAANGLGAGLLFSIETATASTNQNAGLISASWVDATNATRKAKLSLSAYDTAARLGLEIEASGTEPKIGFYGVAPIARAVLATGAGASVDDVITALQNLGLVKQS